MPAKVRVAHFVNDETNKIRLHIFDSNSDSIYHSDLTSRSIHEFVANKTGTYQFILDNESVSYLINRYRGIRILKLHLQYIQGIIQIVMFLWKIW